MIWIFYLPGFIYLCKNVTMDWLKYYLIISFLFCSELFAQNNANPVSVLKNEIELLKKDPCLKNASWGLYVVENETGNQVCAYNSDLVLEPASVMKIVTTGAALSLLGPSFVFETKLEYTGHIDTSGNLKGNLYITGSGDPTPGSKRMGPTIGMDSIFSGFYLAMKQNNIRHINGFIVADASAFEENPAAGSWLWEDIGNYYASGAYGLNINENYYRLYFDAGGKTGSPATLVKMEPYIGEITFINNVRTGAAGSGDNVIIYGQPYTDLRMMDGTVPFGKKNFDVDGAIPDPPAYFAEQFSGYLYNKGITADSSVTTTRIMKWLDKPDTAIRLPITRHLSPNLNEIIRHTNLKSINLFAEAILKAIGKIKKGEGSEKAGIEVVKNFWAAKKVDLKGFVMEDACGLSRKNKISAGQLCEMLRVIRWEKSYDSFRQSLPVAGKSGGMAGMLNNTFAENNLTAKTGNMDRIKSYAGYVTNKAGKELSFAVIFNNYTCTNAELKQKSEKLLLLISLTQ